ncbi:hypothetical protein Scep_004583 [Stephania cephalantha]|uniref:Uncharacterized protein n=1 Tax=Stephania cephalantha TaxID=152367 RepID=A0AAP0KVL4_9MAGN
MPRDMCQHMIRVESDVVSKGCRKVLESSRMRATSRSGCKDWCRRRGHENHGPTHITINLKATTLPTTSLPWDLLNLITAIPTLACAQNQPISPHEVTTALGRLFMLANHGGCNREVKNEFRALQRFQFDKFDNIVVCVISHITDTFAVPLTPYYSAFGALTLSRISRHMHYMDKLEELNNKVENLVIRRGINWVNEINNLESNTKLSRLGLDDGTSAGISAYTTSVLAIYEKYKVSYTSSFLVNMKDIEVFKTTDITEYVVRWFKYGIRSALGYPTFTVGTITGTPEVSPSRASGYGGVASTASSGVKGGVAGDRERPRGDATQRRWEVAFTRPFSTASPRPFQSTAFTRPFSTASPRPSMYPVIV